jgi:hypothetical protein
MSQLALRAKDFRYIAELGHAAFRLEEPQLGMELLHAARQFSGKTKPSAWRGEDISDATLIVELIEDQREGVSHGVAAVGYIKAAAARARQTFLIVEPRMVPLFQRSVPEVVVLPFGSPLPAHGKNRVVTAGPIELAVSLGYDKNTIARLHTHLVNDRDEARLLRESYLHGRSLPVIGIAWWSSHVGKDLPPRTEWARLVREVPAQFVSLQYAEPSADVAMFQEGDASKFIVDPSVNQLKNMDRFASQIAALDLMIAISTSGAHLAGALGQRVILVRDDLFRRGWPYLSRGVPWYPNTTVIGKDARDWPTVFDEIISVAKEMTLS